MNEDQTCSNSNCGNYATFDLSLEVTNSKRTAFGTHRTYLTDSYYCKDHLLEKAKHLEQHVTNFANNVNDYNAPIEIKNLSDFCKHEFWSMLENERQKILHLYEDNAPKSHGDSEILSFIEKLQDKITQK